MIGLVTFESQGEEKSAYFFSKFHSYRGTLYNGKMAPKFWVGAPKFRVWAHKFRVGAPKF